MLFEWDDNKDRVNRAKHGIGFAKAATIFSGAVQTEPSSRGHAVKAQYRSIGVMRGALIVAVIHVDRSGVLRIISARPTRRKGDFIMGRTIRVRLEDLPPISEERLREIEAIRDEDIDFSDIPELDEDWFAKAEWRDFNEPKKQLTVRFDSDVVEFFKQEGRGYQTRMNAVLRAYMISRKRDAG